MSRPVGGSPVAPAPVGYYCEGCAVAPDEGICQGCGRPVWPGRRR